MARINVLDRQVAELIAAGEVVERPASIVKELVENAVDAGATKVTVEIQGGGVRYIRVTDNGGGILREDVKNAFLRHATSKVRVQEDLGNITTMGFRGEALASIAAMCRVEVLTRTVDELEGTRYTIAGGEPGELADAGCPVGTTISVRDVFYNTPARMKFLKKDLSEGNSVAAVVEKEALANPQISFKFIRDGAVRLQTPGGGQLVAAARCVLGREFAEQTIPVSYELEGLALKGLISKPSFARGSRTLQNFFINTRFVRSKTCMAALEEAYRNMLMAGRFPSCVLNLTIPPQTVDVNVHPAKTEVRFANEKSVFDLVYYGCKTALGAHRLAPEIKADELRYNPFAAQTDPQAPKQQRMSAAQYRIQAGVPDEQPARVSAEQYWEQMRASKPAVHGKEDRRALNAPDTVAAPPVQSPQARILPRRAIDIVFDEPDDEGDGQSVSSANPYADSYAAARPAAIAARALPVLAKEPPRDLPAVSAGAELELSARIQTACAADDPYENAALIGELFGTYIVLENNAEMILIDKHAAHERLLYNRLVEEGPGEERQFLLTPVSVRLSPEEHAAVLENAQLLARAGVGIEDFGDGFVVVREAAPVLAGADLAAIVTECAQKLLHANERLTPHVLEELYHTMACRSAIKAHDRTAAPTLRQLVELLRADGDADHCPHGRPVAIRMLRHEIEKKFGRLG
ncbi:DNA mismatch repair endonuclease MutL [Anaerotruncus colihominis]|uniref:DNA mismatch repair protein MutL n=1 Tax=Anaerotruncus colihominis TaxID=169435 RepID=A0A845SW41_9FIRM|nr:DNA mismatch repair endonuclease MutL [Anaerotruncus colihominis]MCR2025916.1 DNA mismatch repair endonuclease MutL [Anaerotruncus colihominis]NDO38532.1 DNA mismatch repair endonuclease MutL [Anaerotruncus colihominis]